MQILSTAGKRFASHQRCHAFPSQQQEVQAIKITLLRGLVAWRVVCKLRWLRVCETDVNMDIDIDIDIECGVMEERTRYECQVASLPTYGEHVECCQICTSQKALTLFSTRDTIIIKHIIHYM